MIRTQYIFLVFICLVLLCGNSLNAQQINVRGTLFNEQGSSVPGAMVMNLRTYVGAFASASGRFSLQADKSDTLVIGAFGYSSRRICFRDSVLKSEYNIDIILAEIKVELGTAEVFAPRELREIYSDIETLGYQASDYRLSGVDALSSPITFLYEAFSKRERSKREVAEMENDDMRRALLKELFHKYVDFEIIDLENAEFDRFIDYLNISDEALQSMSQYEFILYVRDRYKAFQKVKRGMHESDFDYNGD